MFCSKCGKQNQADASCCKHCGAGIVQGAALTEQKRHRKKTVLVVGILAAVLVALVPLGVCPVIAQTPEENRAVLEITDSSMAYDESGYAEVTGTVTNNGDHQVGGCIIVARFYDSDGTVIDTRPDFLYHIGSGDEMRFSILCGKQEAVRYEVYVG